jgi:hypothetical protein
MARQRNTRSTIPTRSPSSANRPPRTVIINTAGPDGEHCSRLLQQLPHGRHIVDLAHLGRSVFFDMSSHVRQDDAVVLIADNRAPLSPLVERAASHVDVVTVSDSPEFGSKVR